MLFFSYTFVFNYLSSITTNYPLIKSELFPACFPCSKKIFLSQSSSGSNGKNIVETPEAMIVGDLSNLIQGLSRSLLRPFC